MMADQGNSEELSKEQQLQKQLEEISLQYQSVLNQSQKMAPKGTSAKRSDPNAENGIDDDDFEEIASVADNLDSLESALNVIEEQADRIREQLLELLTSNREIRQSIREENDKLRESESNENDETQSSPENNEQNNQ